MKKVLLMIGVMVVAGCSNPYDRSKWEEAEQPISEHTNKAVGEGFAEAEQADLQWEERAEPTEHHNPWAKD